MYPKGKFSGMLTSIKEGIFISWRERSTVIILNRIFTILHFEMFQISYLIIHNYGTAVIVNSRGVYTRKEVLMRTREGSMNERNR